MQRSDQYRFRSNYNSLRLLDCGFSVRAFQQRRTLCPLFVAVVDDQAKIITRNDVLTFLVLWRPRSMLCNFPASFLLIERSLPQHNVVFFEDWAVGE